jgi:hypothetical protein
MTPRMLNQFAPMFRLHDEMSRMVDGFFDDAPAARGYAASYPALNIWEAADGSPATSRPSCPACGWRTWTCRSSGTS